MSYKRHQSLEMQFKRQLSSILLNYFSYMISLGTVTLNEKLTLLKIGISSYNTNPIQILDTLNQYKPQIRYQLAQIIKIKYIPEICFFHDKTIDHIMNFENPQ